MCSWLHIRNLDLDISLLYFYTLKDKEDHDVTYYVRKNAKMFILQASQLEKILIWSFCTMSNLKRKIQKCFPQLKMCLSEWVGQEMSHCACWMIGTKPIFFKSLETFWSSMDKFGKYNSSSWKTTTTKTILMRRVPMLCFPISKSNLMHKWINFKLLMLFNF